MTESSEKPPGEILKVDALGRVRTPAEQREAILDSFERSGMPGTRFARQHGIKYQTFASWIQKRRRGRGEYAGQKSAERPEPPAETDDGAPVRSPLMLAEVLIEEKSAEPAKGTDAAPGLRVELTDGTVLVVQDEGQTGLAARLIRELSAGGEGC